MGLIEYDFKPDYNKSNDNIAEDFYIPSMRNAKKYDRISGYFGSTVYIIAWSALREFVENGGKMRIICSPCISDQDKVALTEGHNAKVDAVLKEALEKEFDYMLSLPELKQPTRVLSCLIADGIVDIKMAVPKSGIEPDLKRLFHDKVGVFTDADGNSVGFRGSMNETYQGLSDDGNAESIDVFPSWTDSRDAFRVEGAIVYFNKLWKNQAIDTDVYDFPEAIRKKIISTSNGCNWKELMKEIEVTISKTKKWNPDRKNNRKILRPHQLIALENWEKNGYSGILEHATGSGKTYTAICAIRNALDRGKEILIVVPSKELLKQWTKEIKENITDINISFLLCGDGNNTWKKDDLLSLWTRSNHGIYKITIAIMDTACTPQFVNQVSGGNHLLLIADEVHRIGSKAHRNILKIDTGERLGLSATPVRYGDVEGTKIVFDYFGGIVEPVVSLKDAIKSKVLTPYYYHPKKIKLTMEEQDSWNELTLSINKMLAMSGGDKTNITQILEGNNRLKMQLIERARIIKQAKNKVELVLLIMQTYYNNGQKWIIYCDAQQQLRDVLKLLLNHGYDAYEYSSGMEGDREQTLLYFYLNGGILVSIRCLDEGVNIPSVTHALILASSKNPREFIQRRGRILRKCEGKNFAHLYDAIVVPESDYDGNDKSGSIIEAELSRAIQFGEWAENPTCISDLKIMAMQYGIDYNILKNGGYEYDESEFK